MTPLERFHISYVVDPATGCWNYTKSLNLMGYGRIYDETGKRVYAHRFSYKHLVGSLPDNLVIDHLCCNHSCVNPSHLRACSQYANVHAPLSKSPMKRKALQTHCVNGHEFNVANTAIRKDGHRRCRVCDKLKMRKRRNSKLLSLDKIILMGDNPNYESNHSIRSIKKDDDRPAWGSAVSGGSIR